MSVAIRDLSDAHRGLVIRVEYSSAAGEPGSIIGAIEFVEQRDEADETVIELTTWGSLSGTGAAMVMRGAYRNEPVYPLDPMQPPPPDWKSLAEQVERASNTATLSPRVSRM